MIQVKNKITKIENPIDFRYESVVPATKINGWQQRSKFMSLIKKF